MKVKFTIKTLEELLLTKGIKYEDEEFTCEGEKDVFLFEMIKFCGENGESEEAEDGEVNWKGYAVYEWMCSSWEVTNEKEDRFNNFKDSLFRLNDGTKIVIGVNQETLRGFLKRDSNIYLKIGEMYIGMTFNEWKEIDSKVKEIIKLKEELSK